MHFNFTNRYQSCKFSFSLLQTPGEKEKDSSMSCPICAITVSTIKTLEITQSEFVFTKYFVKIRQNSKKNLFCFNFIFMLTKNIYFVRIFKLITRPMKEADNRGVKVGPTYEQKYCLLKIFRYFVGQPEKSV